VLVRVAARRAVRASLTDGEQIQIRRRATGTAPTPSGCCVARPHLLAEAVRRLCGREGRDRPPIENGFYDLVHEPIHEADLEKIEARSTKQRRAIWTRRNLPRGHEAVRGGRAAEGRLIDTAEGDVSLYRRATSRTSAAARTCGLSPIGAVKLTGLAARAARRQGKARS
jgi:hypothetical protein